MHETKFNDLKIRIGTHYLYQHQGNCRHTIIFTEMRYAARMIIVGVLGHSIICIHGV